MALNDEQRNRQQYLQQVEQQRQQEKADAAQQAEETWEQYKVPLRKPNLKEILGNGWQSIEKEQKRLSELYSKMYNIYKNRPDLLNNISGLYKTVWYDTMSKQEKKIVDYFLWWREQYEVTDDSLNL